MKKKIVRIIMPLLIKCKLLPPEAFASYTHAPLSPVKHTALHTDTYITIIQHAAPGCIPRAITDAQQPIVIIILLLARTGTTT